MEVFDRVLGYAEFGLVPISIVWLLLACWRPNRRRVRRATALAFVLAATVAQPFGVVASEQEASPEEARRTNTDGLHVARLFGVIPVAPFVLYYRDDLLAGLAENTPTATTRARSWFGLPVLTNGTNIADICSNDVFTPCWRPNLGEGAPPGFPNPYADSLELARNGGDYWVTITNPSSAGHIPGQVPDAFTWRLRAGLASPAGLLFWMLAAGLVLAARRRI